jgi:hypothetical protein
MREPEKRDKHETNRRTEFTTVTTKRHDKTTTKGYDRIEKRR